MSNEPVDGPNNQAFWARTDATMPGKGIYASRSARFAGKGVLPGFIDSAEGCRITDADGRTYLDFNCGNGPNLLGYRHPEVDAAAEAQAQKMDLASFFPTSMPEYAERLLAWGQGFDWAIFTKNGSDSTNLSMRIMRAARQRPLVILFDKAYHGFGIEISLSHETQFDANQVNIVRLPWNDVPAFEAFIAARHDEVAGILLNPLDQNPTEVPNDLAAEMVAAIERARKNTGILLSVDDVRAGFRLHPKGSHHYIGLAPDLLCLGKAQANGYATSTVLGVNACHEPAESIRFTATYMFSSVAFQAGIKTLEIYERDHVFEHILSMGKMLCDGIVAAGHAAGHKDVHMAGPPSMPTFLFSNDVKSKRARVFGEHGSRLGAIFHPTLNWFVSYAHKQADIEEAIEIAKQAFERTPTDVNLI